MVRQKTVVLFIQVHLEQVEYEAVQRRTETIAQTTNAGDNTLCNTCRQKNISR